MSTEYMRVWREKNREKIREYNRIYNSHYRKDNGFKNEKTWMTKNPEKVSAQRKAQRAKKNGILIPQPCEFCLNKEVVMHHDDYSKPLEIRWLCKIHHRKIHYGSLTNLALKST